MAVPTKLPTNRRFGLTFCAVFLALGGWTAARNHDRAAAYVFFFAASLALGVIALIAPRVLAPLNRLWFRFGELLGKVVSPIALSVIYFAVLTPIACISRLFGRDEIQLRRQAGPTYWISRNPPGPKGESFRNQF